MLKCTTLYLPEKLIPLAEKYASSRHTTLNALVIEQLEAVTQFNETDPLVLFSRGMLTKEQAISEIGLRDYAQLLVAMGDVNLPLPSLTQEEMNNQVNVFADLWWSK